MRKGQKKVVARRRGYDGLDRSNRKLKRVTRRAAQTQEGSDLLALTTDTDDPRGVAIVLDGADDFLWISLPDELGRPLKVVEQPSLEGAVQVPPHPGYEVRDPSRGWGTPSTVDRLVRAFDNVINEDPSVPRVRLHDLSLRSGGPMTDHVSHQTGRDVDLTYYQHGCPGPCSGRVVSATELDAGRQWHLLRQWLERREAQFVFVDYSLQPPLYKAAQTAGATEQQLADWFQYPRGREVRAGIIRHAPGHANHLHVRFECPSGERCGTPRSQTSESDRQTRELWELLGD
jgi:hypothetical protein